MGWHQIVFHATALLVVGFFVAFAAQRAEGCLKRFGRYLACWLYLLAAATIVLGAVLIYYHGAGGWMGYGGYGHGGYGGGMMGGYHGGNYPVPAPDAGTTPEPSK
ncbi:MAG: hypothetical protein ABSG66_07515 [Stellaceae bacterium]